MTTPNHQGNNSHFTGPRSLLALGRSLNNFDLDTMSGSERILLFRLATTIAGDYFSERECSNHFPSWHWLNFADSSRAESVLSLGITLGQSFFPSTKEYNAETNIAVLYQDYFRLPGFTRPSGRPSDGVWDMEDTRLIIRICFTEDGELYLEWYEGLVTSLNEKTPGMPEKAEVHTAHYLRIPGLHESPEPEAVPDQLHQLIKNEPHMLYPLIFAVNKLYGEEERMALNQYRSILQSTATLDQIIDPFRHLSPFII